MAAASNRTSTIPARTVAEFLLFASRWPRSCWITRWECWDWINSTNNVINLWKDVSCREKIWRWWSLTWMEYMMILKQRTAKVFPSHREWLSKCLKAERRGKRRQRRSLENCQERWRGGTEIPREDHKFNAAVEVYKTTGIYKQYVLQNYMQN